jgi:hypothetical protein
LAPALDVRGSDGDLAVTVAWRAADRAFADLQGM